MRKIAVILLVSFILLLAMAGCGNSSIGFGNYTFNGVHIYDASGNARDYTVEKWYQSGDIGIEVLTKEVGSLWLCEGSYIMYENTCPLCGGKNGK